MTWVRSEDDEPQHPKMLRLTLADYGFFHAAKCWSTRNLTDGFIPSEALGPTIWHGLTRRQAMKHATALAEATDPSHPDSLPLFERRDRGWQIHDYLHYQPSAEEIRGVRQQDREAKVRAGRMGGMAKATASRRLADGVAEGLADASRGGSRTVAERSTESESESESESEPVLRPQKGAATPPGFARFWTSYPRKIGKDDALRSWLKRECESLTDEILTAVDKQRAYLLREDPRAGKTAGDLCPHPATWLNQGRWKDEVLTVPIPAPVKETKPFGLNIVR